MQTPLGQGSVQLCGLLGVGSTRVLAELVQHQGLVAVTPACGVGASVLCQVLRSSFCSHNSLARRACHLLSPRGASSDVRVAGHCRPSCSWQRRCWSASRCGQSAPPLRCALFRSPAHSCSVTGKERTLRFCASSGCWKLSLAFLIEQTDPRKASVFSVTRCPARCVGVEACVLAQNCSSSCLSGAGMAQPPTDPGPWGGRTLVGPPAERNVAPGGRGPGCGLWVGGRACQLALQRAVPGVSVQFLEGRSCTCSRTDVFFTQKQNPAQTGLAQW